MGKICPDLGRVIYEWSNMNGQTLSASAGSRPFPKAGEGLSPCQGQGFSWNGSQPLEESVFLKISPATARRT
ncbi:MAG: hypothetical protein HC827_05440 [Cyanobacteria bacterium RM1_2_2]|nr:hypothetical protein [Cyanobacteria bacterium RM1_2_2]